MRQDGVALPGVHGLQPVAGRRSGTSGYTAASAAPTSSPRCRVVADGDEADAGVAGLQVVGEDVGGVPAEPGPAARVQVVPGDGEPLERRRRRVRVPPVGAGRPSGRAMAMARLTTALRSSAAKPGASEAAEQVDRVGDAGRAELDPVEGVPVARRRRAAARASPMSSRTSAPRSRRPTVSAATGSAAVNAVDRCGACTARAASACGGGQRRAGRARSGCGSCVSAIGLSTWVQTSSSGSAASRIAVVALTGSGSRSIRGVGGAGAAHGGGDDAPQPVRVGAAVPGQGGDQFGGDRRRRRRRPVWCAAPSGSSLGRSPCSGGGSTPAARSRARADPDAAEVAVDEPERAAAAEDDQGVLAVGLQRDAAVEHGEQRRPAGCRRGRRTSGTGRRGLRQQRPRTASAASGTAVSSGGQPRGVAGAGGPGCRLRLRRRR